MVVHCKEYGIPWPLEEQKEPVGFVDLPTLVDLQKIPGQTVVMAAESCSGLVTHSRDQPRAIDEITDQQRLEHRARTG